MSEKKDSNGSGIKDKIGTQSPVMEMVESIDGSVSISSEKVKNEAAKKTKEEPTKVTTERKKQPWVTMMEKTSDSEDTVTMRDDQRITRSATKRMDIGQSHIGCPKDYETRDKEAAREIADGKQVTLTGLW